MLSIMRIRARVRLAGNSLRVAIPNDAAKAHVIVEGQVDELEVVRKVSLKEFLGSAKFRNSAQEMKDEDRK